MELVPLVCLCLLTWSGPTSADEGGPTLIKVKEGSDVLLPCSLTPAEDIGGKRFEWKKDGQKDVFMYESGLHFNQDLSGQDKQFKGRVEYFPDALRGGNASIMITGTKVADSGNYTCEFPNLQPKRQTVHISLFVGAAPEPSVTILNETKDGVLLQCVVRGASPKPLVHWQDSDGNILPAEEQVSERGGSYDIILKTTVTKTDHYYCVSTQEEIRHQTKARIYVPVYESSTRWDIIAAVLGVLLFVVVIILVVLIATNCRCNQGRPPYI